jgi:hypothetical protein
MMVVFEMITTEFRNGMQLVVLSPWKSLAGSHTSTVEFIIWIIHLVTTEYSLQATLIESLVMGNEGKSFNQRLNLLPYLWEYRCFFGILTSKAMHLRTPIIIVIGLWLNQRVE